MSNENGEEFEERDDHTVQFAVAKAEEKKIMLNQLFETVCAKFWDLMKGQAGADLSCDSISQQQYTELLSRIYRVLACLYRESEMRQQITQEWIYDLHGASEMDQNLFTKFLFRIAHQWCASIDLDEYCELLEKVFDRITARKIVRANGKVEIALPQIRVTIDQEKQHQAEESEEEGEWVECDEEEQENEEFEYKTQEDNGESKRFKRSLQISGEPEKKELFLSSREPFYYVESVVYHQPDEAGEISVVQPSNEDFYGPVLTDHTNIFPMGYPTEQYLCWMKNDVHKAHLFIKAEKKAALQAMQRDLFAGTQAADQNRAPQLSDKDRGLLNVFNKKVTQFFPLHRVDEPVRVLTIALMHDGTYNQFRELMKDSTQLIIRPSMEHPQKTKKDKQRTLDLTIPLKRKSAFGHNPTLERRLNYKLSSFQLPGQSQPSRQFININYLIFDPVFDTAYRSDVTKIETTNKMAIKPSDEFVREEDFCNVVTSFRDSVQIMLQKKYETFFTIKLQGDSEQAIERDNKIYQLERNRKGTARINEKLTSKSFQEKFEESNAFLKSFRGPFYKLESKTGPSEDDFLTCGTHDLINTVNKETHRVLVIGKPRSGKTTLAKQIEKRLNLTRVSADVWIQNLFKKIKDREENPPEEEPEPVLEEGQEPPPKKSWLQPLEESVLGLLKGGGAPSSTQIDEMIKELLSSSEARTKGFVLDLDFSAKNEKSWVARIQNSKFLAEPEFTHIVDIMEDKNETFKKAAELRVTPTDGILFSKWERDERAKPKKPLNDDEEPVDEEDENAPKPLNENDLIQRECDNLTNISQELENYERRERDQIDMLISKLYHSTFIKVQSAGLTPDEIAESVVYRLKRSTSEPLVPVATIIEGGASSFKDLLTQEVNTDEGQLPRQWSLWRTTDPVSLTKGKVQPGLPEFAAHYANNVFVFSSEENLKVFVKEPRLFLGNQPQMPADFRILMLGPNGAGIPEQAKLLEAQYGWRVVDFQAIVKKKLAEILAFERKPPNNISSAGPCMIGLSSEELTEIKDGKTFAAWKFLPWILEYLQVPLAIQPKVEQGVVEPNPDEMNEEEKKTYEKEQKKKAEEKKKKEKEEEEIRKAKEDRARRRAEAIEAGQDLAEAGLEESEEEIKIEDLSITRIMAAKDQEGNIPRFGRFVLYGFPQTEIHMTKLKEFGFAFDRVCYLNDTTEEEPGREIKQRMLGKSDLAFDWEDENARAQKVLANVKEFIGEEGILEIDCTGKQEDVLIKIRTKLDPFFLLCDNLDDVRTSADLNLADEDNPDKRLPKSDFGDFCPVTYTKHGFIVKGSAELESVLYGKTYRFASEDEKKEFEFNPTIFIKGLQAPLAPPAPKIMIIGLKGSGVSSQIQKLCEKFKIESLDLMAEFLKQTKVEKDKRRRARLLARGFKAMPPPEDEEAEPEPDPEIEDEGEGFDAEVDAVRVLQSILKADKPLVINGNWTTLPEGSIEASLDKLLTDAKRAPEIVIVLKCKEKSTFDRCIDDQKIKNALENDQKKREETIKMRKEAERKTKLAELTEEIKLDEENEERNSLDKIKAIIEDKIKEFDEEQENAENPEEEVADYATRREEVDTKMKEQLEKDAAFLESFVEGIKGEDSLNPRVVVVEAINTDISAEFVHIKILEKIKNHMQHRENLIEREQAQVLKPSEVKHYEASFTYRHSKFGRSSPLSPFNPCKTKDFAVLYRERIYFLGNKAEQIKFLLEPSKYTMGKEPVPLDIEYRPTASVIGLPASGKSALASIISQKTGMVHLKPEDVIEFFITKESFFSEKLRLRIKQQGSELDDSTLIDMLSMRIQFKDCLERGWVLDGFPQNRTQAIQMAKQSMNPDIVFHVQVPTEEVFRRTEQTKFSDFGSNRNILVRRLNNLTKNIPQTSFFYQKYYNSLVSVNGMKSRWYMEDVAMNAIEKVSQSRFQFSRDMFFNDRPCILENLNYDRCLVKQSLSQYAYMCPVSWKVQKKFVNCAHKPENAVLYKDAFYFFATKNERDVFVNNPKQFTERVLFCQDRNVPKRYRAHKAAEIISQEKSLLGHCPVTLKDEERVEKGYQLSVVSYKDNRYIFASEEKATRFFQNPGRYCNIQLPVKMPPIKDPVILFQLQKQDDSITFMEQALGQVVTRGLREVGENRLKYPTLSVKETMLKLFAIFLKAENPANTVYMREKYRGKMKEFIYRCEVPQELHELSLEKKEKQEKNRKWPQFKEDYYNKLGEKFDSILQEEPKETAAGFASYIK